jgi:hypothetical protein
VAFERIQQQTREREVAEVIGAEQEAQTALTEGRRAGPSQVAATHRRL